ncbi:hypothetical protein FRC18_003294 [Serendipita sp. 400]|nr:hypothetical protein FRC18_003294 [Serendipita sp. 400]
MIIRKSPQTAPIDRPFPDENTVAEMYCNEAYTIDNEAVEDWTSSLQMLLTFAAIFSAVLITLIVDSKTLLEQDNTDVLVDAVVFLMNNLANGTHQPYSPPKFRPSTRSILVNCFLFGSLCLSIATALAAVLAMQWVTDYGAVTRRAGSTPEERVRRRHFRYQGRQDWKMDTIIGALPIALHLSVLLFFVGLILWMWDVHHSIFGVVFVCGALAALFYIFTTALAVFCPSCPYRTPLASWIYTLLHLIMTILSHFTWLRSHESRSQEKMEKEEIAKGSGHTPGLWQPSTIHHRRFAQFTLSSRDDVYIQNPDKKLLRNSLIWLSNHISISPDVYRRLLVLVNGLASVLDPAPDSPVSVNVPWNKIIHALGAIYQSFVQNLDLSEEAFVEFAGQTHCLSQPGMKEIVESKLGNKEIHPDDHEFPARLLHTWTISLSSHTSDAHRKQRFSDEAIVRDSISSISSTPQAFLQSWYQLLDDEEQTCDRILPELLISDLETEGRLHVVLYLISTRSLPWASSVHVGTSWRRKEVPSSPLTRRLRIIDWVEHLPGHPKQEEILRILGNLWLRDSDKILLFRHEVTDEETAELRRLGFSNLDRWKRPEAMLHSILVTFDRMLAYTNTQGSTSNPNPLDAILSIIYHDLMRCDLSFDSKFLQRGDEWDSQALRQLSNPILRAVACVVLGIEWKDEWLLGLIEEMRSINHDGLSKFSRICFKNPPFIDGDCTSVWLLRFRLWIHLDPLSVIIDFQNSVHKVDKIRRIEQEIQSSRLGITHTGDFMLALIHLNYSYTWTTPYYHSLTLIPDTLTGNKTSRNDGGIISKECIEYLANICRDISPEPARLIRLLIELVRADINHDPQDRRPENLMNLLKHAKNHLASKELRPFRPSCRRLVRYIQESYQQFESVWNEATNQDHEYRKLWPHYEEVERGELWAVVEEVIDLLQPKGAWDGEEVDVSWPRHLLRPTGCKGNPYEEDAGDQLIGGNEEQRNGLEAQGEVSPFAIEEADAGTNGEDLR